MSPIVRRFPNHFLFGTATSSAQVEGGATNHSWFRWSELGKIKDGTHARRGCDHWHRVDQDIALQRELHQHTHRFSIEWSRVEPTRGVADPAAIRHYRAEVEALVAAGIRPLVTLHHFSSPLWFDELGGWTRPEAADDFVRYANTMVDALGDLVADWVTINEPNVYLLFGHVLGIWPPGEQEMERFFAAARVMVRAHLAAYAAIHTRRSREGFEETSVGAAHHLRLYDPAGGILGRTVARAVCALYYRLTQDIFVTGMTTGRMPYPLSKRGRVGRESAGPPPRPGLLPGHGYWSDFLGINYYSRDMVHLSANPGRLFGQLTVRPGSAVNDLGWEIYPEGLARVVKRYAARYPLPVFITENGTADAQDSFRTRYIHDHLAVILDLIAQGIDVRRYYHWTLMDNFEWLEGESARFGLIETDFETQQRTIRPSGRYYAEVARTRTLPALSG